MKIIFKFLPKLFGNKKFFHNFVSRKVIIQTNGNMRTITQYQIAKSLLIDFAKEIKLQYPKDKPMIRQEINLFCDSLERDLPRGFDKIRLQSVTCKLHPKD